MDRIARSLRPSWFLVAGILCLTIGLGIVASRSAMADAPPDAATVSAGVPQQLQPVASATTTKLPGGVQVDTAGSPSAVAVSSGQQPTMVQQILMVVIPTVVLPFFGWLSVLLGNWLRANVKNAKVSGILQRLDTFVADNVRAIAQTYVDAAKASGGFNSQAQASAKAQVLAQLKAHLGAQGISEITTILGISDVDSFLATKVEAMVHNVSTSTPAASAVTVNMPQPAPVAAPAPPPAS